MPNLKVIEQANPIKYQNNHFSQGPTFQIFFFGGGGRVGGLLGGRGEGGGWRGEGEALYLHLLFCEIVYRL